jgi:hypothetical protein
MFKYHQQTLKNKLFYNVFRATRSKTTSLPAALNQARRIDTLDECYSISIFSGFAYQIYHMLYIVMLREES